MQFFCKESKNSQRIVEAFKRFSDERAVIFMAGPEGSEFELLQREYLATNPTDIDRVFQLEPEAISDVHREALLKLDPDLQNANGISITVRGSLSDSVEQELIAFADEPPFPGAKIWICLPGYEVGSASTLSEDLQAKANHSLFVIPPLKNRHSDIAWFAAQELKDFRKEPMPASPFSDEAIDLLMSYEWPGNYQELKQVMRVLALKIVPNGEISGDQMEEVIGLARTLPIE